MGIQRDLLFRKKEVATALGRSAAILFKVSAWCKRQPIDARAAEQTKRECTQDVRKLTSGHPNLTAG